jgi:uncharacterized protein YgiB involved in biofilm formation
MKKFISPSVAALFCITAAGCETADYAKKQEQIIAAFQTRETVIFPVKEGINRCARRYSREDCKASWDQAQKLGYALRPRYIYGGECAQKHGVACDRQVSTDGLTYRTTSYYPEIIAWEALSGELRQSVPLFSGSDGEYVYLDGSKPLKNSKKAIQHTL